MYVVVRSGDDVADTEWDPAGGPHFRLLEDRVDRCANIDLAAETIFISSSISLKSGAVSSPDVVIQVERAYIRCNSCDFATPLSKYQERDFL